MNALGMWEKNHKASEVNKLIEDLSINKFYRNVEEAVVKGYVKNVSNVLPPHDLEITT